MRWAGEISKQKYTHNTVLAVLVRLVVHLGAFWVNIPVLAWIGVEKVCAGHDECIGPASHRSDVMDGSFCLLCLQETVDRKRDDMQNRRKEGSGGGDLLPSTPAYESREKWRCKLC